MSIRHQMRARVEELFKIMIESESFPREEEVTVYAVFVPREKDWGEERIEVSEHELSLEDKDSVKAFLDRTTREALEGDVKNLYLACYVFESEEGLRIVTKEKGLPEDKIKSRIERMREGV